MLSTTILDRDHSNCCEILLTVANTSCTEAIGISAVIRVIRSRIFLNHIRKLWQLVLPFDIDTAECQALQSPSAGHYSAAAHRPGGDQIQRGLLNLSQKIDQNNGASHDGHLALPRGMSITVLCCQSFLLKGVALKSEFSWI